MDAVDPALFYTGLVAQLYAPLRSSGPADPEPYARFIAASGQPALELGCGDGDPLLDLRARGLDVEGLDSSSDMLQRCGAAAAERGLAVTLHEMPMVSMELRRRYRSIYLAGATFNLIVDDDTAWQALARIRAHLEPEGSALIPLFVPRPMPVGVIGVPRSHMTDDGATMRVTVVSEDRDEEARLLTTVLRYELEADGRLVSEERPWLLHWHTQEGFRQLVGDAGLLVGACWRLTAARRAPMTSSSPSGSPPIPPSTPARRSAIACRRPAGLWPLGCSASTKPSTASGPRWRSWPRPTLTASTWATSISTSSTRPRLG